MSNQDQYYITAAIIFIMCLICIFFLNPIHQQNLQKHHKEIVKIKRPHKEPIRYISSKVTGNVESIHILGRTEVVPVTKIQLTRYFYEDNLWVLEEPVEGGIIQPKDRKGYFMPVLSGSLNAKYGSAQLVESGNVGWVDKEDDYWSEFRVANIIFKNEEPLAVRFTHYNYDYKNGSWTEIAGYEAIFNKGDDNDNNNQR